MLYLHPSLAGSYSLSRSGGAFLEEGRMATEIAG
jgi:hypothetical protein